MESENSIRNLFIFFAVVLFASAVGWFAYFFPKTIFAASNAIVTSISIIFALSLSLITLASSQVKVSEDAILKSKARQDIEYDMEWENDRIIFRQKLSVFIMLTSVILGIVFIGLEEFAPESMIYALVGAAFAFFTTLSFAIAFVLPFSIASIIRRNRFFRVSQKL